MIDERKLIESLRAAARAASPQNRLQAQAVAWQSLPPEMQQGLINLPSGWEQDRASGEIVSSVLFAIAKAFEEASS